MAISIRGNAGAWAASNATTQTVTLPTHATGDMLIVRAVRKPFTNPNDIVCNTTGWNPVGTGVANGSTANGVGVGSMAFKAFYKVATSAAETNPVVTWGTTAAPGAACAVVYQLGAGEGWVTPTGTGGGDATARTSQTSTMSSHISVTAGDMCDFFRAACDDSGALTVPNITQTGVTFGTVAEQPATALLDGTSNDIAADGGYRLATAGTSSAAAVITGTSASSEQHGAWQTRLRVQVVTNAPAGLASGTGTANNTVIPSDNAYEAAIFADYPVFVASMEEASGNITDLIGGKVGTAGGSPTYGVTGPITGKTAITFDAGTDEFFFSDHADLDLGGGPFSIEFWLRRNSDAGVIAIIMSKGINAADAALRETDVIGLFKDNNDFVAITDAVVPVDATYRHYVITYNGTGAGNTLIYTNGVEGHTDVDTAQTLLDTTDDMTLGGTNNLASTVAYFALYKTVLSGARVAAHYAAASSGTSAAAGNAAGTGSAGVAGKTVAPSGGSAAGTGTAQVANKNVAPRPGNAAGAGTAGNVTASTTDQAPAVTASGTGAGLNATTAIVTNAAQATGTGTASNATVTTRRDATAELASGTGAAYGVTTLIVTNAAAATGTGSAGAASANVAPNAGQANGIGSAFDATAEATTASTDADAELATGTGTAQTASVTVLVNAAHASGTGAALDITASTTDEAPAGTATGTGNALTPRVAIVTNAAQATGTGAAADATKAVTPHLVAGSGTGTAFDATTTSTGNKEVDAGLATGTGTAFGATVQAGGGHVDVHVIETRRMRRVHPERARGDGFAFDARIVVVPNVRVQAEVATGRGEAFDASTVWDDDEVALRLLLVA